ncbi:hypothetical protein MKX01_014099 [Papaver californicum]|nr:hypothetical protein MKX01_014099 [Papaver californicum]
MTLIASFSTTVHSPKEQTALWSWCNKHMWLVLLCISYNRCAVLEVLAQLIIQQNLVLLVCSCIYEP